MKSMTGFGRASASESDFELTVEVSSVNRRGLEVSCSFPRDWGELEPLAASVVKEFYTRAKVGVSAKLSRRADCANPLNLDAGALRRAVDWFRAASADLGAEFVPDANFILKLSERLALDAQEDGQCGGAAAYGNALESALREALRRADEMRSAEGENLCADFLRHLEFMSETVLQIEALAKSNPQNYRDRLLRRLASMGLQLDISDERVVREVSIFADKADVTEECTRLKSHISQFERAAKSGSPCGRELDFVCQEMARETNTIASKANCLEITKLAVALKNELERVREQVQNVE